MTSDLALPGPVGRTLHVVDLGGLVVRSDRLRPHRRRTGGLLRGLVHAYAGIAEPSEADDAVLLDVDAVPEEPCGLTVFAPCPWLGEWGPVSLTPERCFVLYDRVVVGSGSDRLARFASGLSNVGVPVIVVHRAGRLSPLLAGAAQRLFPLSDVAPHRWWRWR